MVLEVHGALRNDVDRNDWVMYQHLCRDAIGLAWAGYPVPGAGSIGSDDYSEARVDPGHFTRFVARAWRAHNSSVTSSLLDDEYDAGMAQSLELTRLALDRLGQPTPQ